MSACVFAAKKTKKQKRRYIAALQIRLAAFHCGDACGTKHRSRCSMIGRISCKIGVLC
jgi:hypothetical protein